MTESFADAVEAQLGRPVRDLTPRAGGDINDAYRLTLEGGATFFLKTHRAPPAGMYAAEAAGLAWLAEAGGLRVPRVEAVTERFLVLEDLGDGRPGPRWPERVGRGLAAVHRAGADGFGWARANTIGSLPQDNRAEADWPTFYAERRLRPQLRRAVDGGVASRGLVDAVERVIERLPSLVGDAEPPARLHGDLWSGNLHTAASGEPCLIDPAVYGGHREIDFAMMKLFGGFGGAVFAAYDEVWPLAPGWEGRVALYQLYPLLVHVNLFGGGYVASAERAARRYG